MIMKKYYFYVWSNILDTRVEVKSLQEWYAAVIHTANMYIDQWYKLVKFSWSKLIMNNANIGDMVFIFHSNTLYLRNEETVDVE